jgi:Domain of unknown function (DUF4132)
MNILESIFGSKECRIPVEPFRWEPNDPLAAEHLLVAQLITDTLKSGWLYYKELDLALTGPGKKILEADPETSARTVSALVAHTSHYDSLTQQVKAQMKTQMERSNWHHTLEWKEIWPPRQVCAQALRRVMRRKLPLTSQQLMDLSDWMAKAEWLADSWYPLKAFIKAAENYGAIGADETNLRNSLSTLSRLLRKNKLKDNPKLAHQIERVLNPAAEMVSHSDDEPPMQRQTGPDPSIPALAGSPNVLVQLKQFLGILPRDNPATAEIGYDHFPLRPDSPLREEHEMINMLLTEMAGQHQMYDASVLSTTTGRAILTPDKPGREKILLAVAERCVNVDFVPSGGLADHLCMQSQYNVYTIFLMLLKRKIKLDRDTLFDVLLFATVHNRKWADYTEHLEPMLQAAEEHAVQSPLTPGERHVLHRVRAQFVRTCPFGFFVGDVARLTRLIGDDIFLALVPGEAWSDAVNNELGRCSPSVREKWLALVQHAATAASSRPSAKWLKTAKEHINSIGPKEFSSALFRWFPLFNAPRTIRLLGGESVHEDNATGLRGLLWMSPEVVSPDLVRIIGTLTASCFKKIPGVGPRAPKVGNAGVYALSQFADTLAVGQLALLKVKVKSGSAQKEIEKAFNAAAERSGLPREELEEMSVPTYGLTDVGICEEPMGEFTARLSVTGTASTELVWVKPDGKIQRAVPASVKESHKEDLKELQAAAKDIQKMLPAQRERIDGIFLQQKSWPASVWRERYLNHPLVGFLARRILWDCKIGNSTKTVIWFNGRLVDFDLKPVDLPDETIVQLWHPIGRPPEEIVAWRSWLDEQQIQQPFKQAHRELYVLTDAERNTRTYSNRYAAHVLKQHQFNALCAARGWKNKLRLMVDDAYPPASLSLPQWGLRAEFWIESLGTDYGTDTNDSGTFLYLTTDQVRFYRVDAAQRMTHPGGGYQPAGREQGTEPLSLEEIPPLVFTEVMRDVDMFVGVASVGNDPAWADGGREGRYQNYWQNYSFGDLNASAKTRKEVLERLVPKLKIAGRCSFLDKFLVVKGSLRTYKIHLGSGNILMEPNDQYLCIVPKQGEITNDPLILPFEGDRTLSVILSKVFLLADDAKIKDPTILGQIKR